MAKKTSTNLIDLPTHRDYRIIMNNQFILFLITAIMALSVAFLYINYFNIRTKAMDVSEDNSNWNSNAQPGSQGGNQSPQNPAGGESSKEDVNRTNSYQGEKENQAPNDYNLIPKPATDGAEGSGAQPGNSYGNSPAEPGSGAGNAPGVPAQ